MTWDILNKSTENVAREAQKKQLEEKQELERIFKRCFTTEDGEKALQHLSQTFIYNNNTPLEAANINYVAAYKNGESGVIKYIIHLLTERIHEHPEEKET